MKITSEESKTEYRYYIIATIGKPCVLRVLPKDDDLFLECMGDMIIGRGDSVKAAIEDWERRKRQEHNKRNWGWAEQSVEMQNEWGRRWDDLCDWMMGRR